MVFQKSTFELITELIPFKIVINILVFIIIIQYYEKMTASEIVEDESDENNNDEVEGNEDGFGDR